MRILFSWLLAWATTLAAAGAADAPRLNVLFFISDDCRTELSCYASPLAKTPNLDALAATGVRFERAYCQFPLCNPSRVSMLTGRHPTTTGVLGNRTDFRAAHPDWITLPQWFKQKGWASLRTGKIFHGGIDDAASWTEGVEPRATRGEGAQRTADPDELRSAQNRPKKSGDATLTQAQRSDRWLVLEGNGESHGDHRTADRAIEFLRTHREKPFFLGCGFVKPHSPPTAPKKFYDLFDVDKIPLPPDFAPRPTVPEGFPKAAIRLKNADLFIGRDASPQEAREMIGAYLASIAWMDWNVGRVLAELDRLGLREKTIIVFWGDHGYQLGEKGKWSKAGSLFEPGDRVPFIIAAPHVKGNRQACVRVVQAVDFFPTLAELCGLPLPPGLEGRSLVPLLNNPQAAWSHPAYTVWSEDGRTLHGIAVRTEQWRYAEFGDNGKNGAMLFDESADRHEMKNVADDPAYAEARTKLAAWVKEYAVRHGSR